MIGTALTHYRITAKLGEGGMGEVYRATDTKLGREVAIKILPASFSRDPQSLARFEREAKALASLNHPHIAAIHGFDAVQGTHFLVLELVEGETLAERLRRGRLPVEEALSVARQIAEAVEAAHAKGIIHRDLKPGNIKFTPEGRVKVLDFGLAKLSHPGSAGVLAGGSQGALAGADAGAPSPDAPTQVQPPAETTTPGAIMGTPAYMSPEQARGLEVDKRTDVWALGCCLFECLAGRKPFRGETVTDMMSEVLKGEPDWSALPAEVPREVATLLRRCLEKNPRRRLSSLGDIAILLEDLTQSRQPSSISRRATEANKPLAPSNRPSLALTLAPWIAVLALLAFGIGWWFNHQHGQTPKPSPSTNEPPKTLAVLPFANTSADKSDDSFSDGVTDELITTLQKIKGLRVQGRMSSFYFKGKTETPQRIGEQLKVEHLLHGSVSRDGSRLRISVDLVTAASGFSLWSTNYDRQLADTFAIRTEVAQQVAQGLKIQLGMEETRSLAQKPTANPEAHRFYLLGRYHLGRVTEAGFTNAMQYFTQALQLDPSYALAYCGLADSYGWIGWYGLLSGKEAWTKQKELAQKALALDPNLADAHVSLGLAIVSFFDWNGGERAIKRALELNPKLAMAYDQLAWVQTISGRSDEAIRNSQKAIELDPLSLMFNTYLGWHLITARRYDEAMAQLRKTLELDPSFADAQFNLGWCLFFKEDTAGAIASFQKAKSLDPQPWRESALACAYAQVGDRAKAEQVVRDLEDRAKPRYLSPALRMHLHLGLGEKDKAQDWLEKCYEEQDAWCWGLKVWPMFDPLRTEPRFQALLKKVGLDK